MRVYSEEDVDQLRLRVLGRAVLVAVVEEVNNAPLARLN